MKFITTALLSFLIGLSIQAHEGHDKTPGSMTAPHGGQLKGTSQLYVELVSDSNGFKLYVVDHELKQIPIKDVKIEGTTKLPKLVKTDKLNFKSSDSYLEAKVDAKGSHRYTADLKITYKGKTDNISFNVEPQD